MKEIKIYILYSQKTDSDGLDYNSGYGDGDSNGDEN